MIQLYKHGIYAQCALNNSSTRHREDETHLWKKLSTVDFAHENFGSTPASRRPSVFCFSSLLQGLSPVPPVNVPAQTHAGDPALPCGQPRTALQEVYPSVLLATCQLDPSINCVAVYCGALWLSPLSFWVTR